MSHEMDSIIVEEWPFPHMIKHYQISFLIGEGSCGTVFQGKNMRTNEPVALKFVNRDILNDTLRLGHLEKELRIIERIKHPGIVRHIETIYTDTHVVIVQELLIGGTMDVFIQPNNSCIKYNVYLRWAKEILETLAFLHQKGIAHGDIKPENIGFDQFMHAKLIDFGLCTEANSHQQFISGTPLYIAPEIVNQQSTDYSKADIWAFGVTLHFIVTGEYPFRNIHSHSFFRKIKNQSFIVCKCGGPLGDIIRQCLVVNPIKRASSHDILCSDVFQQAEIVADFSGLFKPKRFIKSTNTHSSFRSKKPLIITPRLRCASQKPFYLTT